MLIKIEGFNEAIQGYTVRHGEKVYVYDYDQMIVMTAKDNNMSREAARLYLEKNVLDVFASDGAPVFRYKL
jgi:hypothetical protein|tara:strand:+ start:848 stop:1060 length:213 start_codon:yes stop_codon:yes gene_type:complete